MHGRIYNRFLWQLVLLILLARGVLTPPATYAMGTKDPPKVFTGGKYLLFMAEQQGTRITILQMDGEGNLSFKSNFNITPTKIISDTLDYPNIDTSPDGRVVTVSGGDGEPTLNVFFIGEDGQVSPPLSLNNPRVYGNFASHWNPVLFHKSLPLFYVGFLPISCYRYSLAQHQIELTSQSLALDTVGSSKHLLQSIYSNTLVLRRIPSGTNGTQLLQTVHLNPDGSFGQVNPPMHFSLWYMNGDMTLSPDGRWLVATTMGTPQLHLVRLNQDGSSTVTQQISFHNAEIPNYNYLAFTPSGRGLLMACMDGTYALRLYELDPDTGQLTFKDGVTMGPAGGLIASPHVLALTPDGRYAVFGSVHYPFDSDAFRDDIFVVRVHEEDWSLEYLGSKQFELDHCIDSLGFGILPETAAGPQWALYE